MKKENLSNTHNDIKKLLKKHNLKMTPQRAAIYNEIVGSKEHPATVKIFKKVREVFPNISFDTVNRTLSTFVDIGLIKSVEYSGESRRFDPNTKKHHHFICVKCGRIIDFESREFDNLNIPEDIKKRYEVLEYKVTIEGICDRCKK